MPTYPDLIKKWLNDFERYINELPYFCQFFAKPISTLLWLCESLRTDVWFISGEESVSKEKLDLSYAGSECHKRYFLKQLFGEVYQENHLGRIWLWNYMKTIQRSGCKCTLMVTELFSVVKFLRIKNSFFIPAWVDGGVKASLSLSRSAKSDIQKMTKNGMHFVLSDDPDKFDDFYYNMHVPYIRNTYGDLAIILDYIELKRKFGEKGRYNRLFLLRDEENQDRAAVLVGLTKKNIYLHYLGVKDGNFEMIKEGIIGILFSYPVQYAKEHGLKWVNYGLSRPFIKDGTLNFKKKRGLQISKIYQTGYAVTALAKTPAFTQFLINNPFICADGSSLHCALFFAEDQLPSTEDLRQFYNDHFVAGLSKIDIYHFGQDAKPICANIPEELADKFSVYSADHLFSRKTARRLDRMAK